MKFAGKNLFPNLLNFALLHGQNVSNIIIQGMKQKKNTIARIISDEVYINDVDSNPIFSKL
jgi:hypothetical protein